MNISKEIIVQESAVFQVNGLHMVNGESHSTSCYSCGICTSSCPVAMGPNFLDPRRIVHLANLGKLDLDRAGSSIWSCLDCHRCGNLCPNGVSPWLLIGNLRREAVQEGRVPGSLSGRLHKLKGELVTVLSNTLGLSSPPQYDELVKDWDLWARTPEIPAAFETIPLKPLKRFSHSINHSLCMTCRECSSACPVCVTTAGFDPLYFIRCYALGISPERAALWSCLQCESCSQACTQSVKGHLVIKALQEEQEEFFRVEFQMRITETRERVFSAYLSRVNDLVAGISL